MKKILFIAALFLSTFTTKAQTITFLNDASCDVVVTNIMAAASTCPIPGFPVPLWCTSGNPFTVTGGGGTVSYTWSTAPWSSACTTPYPSSGPILWTLAAVEDASSSHCGGAAVGDCPGMNATLPLNLCCPGLSSWTVDWSRDPFGNVTVHIH